MYLNSINDSLQIVNLINKFNKNKYIETKYNIKKCYKVNSKNDFKTLLKKSTLTKSQKKEIKVALKDNNWTNIPLKFSNIVYSENSNWALFQIQKGNNGYETLLYHFLDKNSFKKYYLERVAF